ncbi:MAG TPA: alkaline phosphatase family protein [Myxococcales bacterium]|nr:alkaline phosphatase family protein [Myxococcales bacterium]
MKLLVLAAALAPFTCSPQAADWGLGAITTMATPADPPLQCSFSLPPDPAAQQRASCAFGQGALASQTLGITPDVAAEIPIRHVIVMMKENRSFDHLFGRLHDEGQPATEAEPATFTNVDLSGAAIAPFHEPTTCVPIDPGHQADSVNACLAGGEMSGFVQNAALTSGTDGHSVMGTYDQTDLPFYFWLASTYALSDRHFAAVASGTYANRNFYLFASNAGVSDTGITYPDPATPSILQLLMNAGFTWAAYTDSQPFSGTADWDETTPGVHSFEDFLSALDQGTLPNVAFVDGVENVTDDHPTADLQQGEAWTREIYEHAIASPQWSRLAILWTYDEAGGFADHVPPPTACQPLPSTSPFTQMGPRVPLVVISRWAKLGYVSHVVHDHTAITRFIETIFGLPALTARDANSDALLDLFDFSCDQPETAPGPGPDAGTGGCTMSAL